jgi:hypothetical protein
MAGVLLAAVLFFLPAGSAAIPLQADRVTAVPVGTTLVLTRLWDFLARWLPGERTTPAANDDNGWQIDPDGDSVPEKPAGPGADNGWLIDPNG